MINLTALNNRIEIAPYDTYVVSDLIDPILQHAPGIKSVE
jgi:hypothetical protein